MGTRRIERSVSLSIEPLEDRFLLSGASISAAWIFAAPAPPHSVAAQPQAYSPLLTQSYSSTHETMSGPIVAVGPAKYPQQETGNIHPNEAGSPPSGAQARSGPVTGVPPPTPNPAISDKGILQILYSEVSAHTAIYPDARGEDRDDDSPTMEYDEVHLPTHQAAFEQYLSTTAITGLHDSASVGLAAISAQPGSLHSALDSLSAAGLGTVGFASMATVLPAATASLETWWGHGQSERDEERGTTPQIPESQPLIIPPPVAVPDIPSPASSTGYPFADLLPLDMEAIQRSADAFFEQLASLSEEWSDSRMIEKLTPWLLAASVAAYEWLRLRRMRSFSVADFEENRGPESVAFLVEDEG